MYTVNFRNASPGPIHLVTIAFLLVSSTACAVTETPPSRGAEPAAIAAGVVGPSAVPTKPARARRTEWTTPTKLIGTDLGVRVVNLGTVTMPQGNNVLRLVTYLATASPAGSSRTRLVPDTAGLTASDSAGRQYPVSYTEVAQTDGVTIGAVSIQAIWQGEKTLALSIPALRTVDGQGTLLQGQWSVDLARQIVDDPSEGRITSMANLSPVDANGTIIQYWPGGRLEKLTIAPPGSPEQTVYTDTGINQPSAGVRVLTKDEYERLLYGGGAPPTPAPYTPGPGAPPVTGTPAPPPKV